MLTPLKKYVFNKAKRPLQSTRPELNLLLYPFPFYSGVLWHSKNVGKTHVDHTWQLLFLKRSSSVLCLLCQLLLPPPPLPPLSPPPPPLPQPSLAHQQQHHSSSSSLEWEPPAGRQGKTHSSQQNTEFHISTEIKIQSNTFIYMEKCLSGSLSLTWWTWAAGGSVPGYVVPLFQETGT